MDATKISVQVARGGGVALGGRIMERGLALVLHLVLGRVLGPAVYGVYALGRSLTAVPQMVALLGLDQGLVRFGAIFHHARDVARLKSTFVVALAIPLCLSSIAAAAFLAFGHHLSGRVIAESALARPLRVFALAVPIYVVAHTSAALVQSLRRIRDQQTVRVSASATNVAVVCGVLALGMGLMATAYAYLFSCVVGALLGLHFVRRTFHGSAPADLGQIRSVAGRLIRFSIPLCMVPLAANALYHADRIMLGYYLDSTDVGMYNACVVVASQVLEFSAPIAVVLSPMVASLHDQERTDEIRHLYRSATRWIFALAAPACVLFVVFPSAVLSVFGSAYVDASRVLAVLAAAAVVGVATGPKGLFLHMSGYPHVDAINGAAALALNIFLNTLLIPRYGIDGAAAATALAVALAHLARLIEVKLLCGMLPYDRWTLAPVAAAALGVAAGYAAVRLFLVPAQIPPLWGCVPGLGAYMLVMWRVGLAPSDREVIAVIRDRLRDVATDRGVK